MQHVLCVRSCARPLCRVSTYQRRQPYQQQTLEKYQLPFFETFHQTPRGIFFL